MQLSDWSKIEADERYTSKPLSERSLIKRAFFDKVVADNPEYSSKPDNVIQGAFNIFDQRTTPTPESPGFFKSTMGDIAGGVIDYVEMAGRAGRALPGGEQAGTDEGGIFSKAIKWAEDYKDAHPWMSDNIQRTGLSNWFHQGLRSFVTSAASGLPGAAAGAAAGSVFPGLGTLAGGLSGEILGYIAASAPTFGLSQYDQVLEQATKAGVPRETAEASAIRQGLYESGGELLSDLVTFGGGKILTSMGKEALKDGVASVFKANAKNMLKYGTGVLAAETSTEMLTQGGESAEQKRMGLSDQGFIDGAISAFGPSAVASIMFAALGGSMHASIRSNLKNTLKEETANPNERLAVAGEVRDAIASTSKPLADQWYNVATQAIKQNQPIDLDAPVNTDLTLDRMINRDMNLAEAAGRNALEGEKTTAKADMDEYNSLNPLSRAADTKSQEIINKLNTDSGYAENWRPRASRPPSLSVAPDMNFRPQERTVERPAASKPASPAVAPNMDFSRNVPIIPEIEEAATKARELDERRAELEAGGMTTEYESELADREAEVNGLIQNVLNKIEEAGNAENLRGNAGKVQATGVIGGRSSEQGSGNLYSQPQGQISGGEETAGTPEIPELKTTGQAVRFGEEATEEQIAELDRRRGEISDKVKQLTAENNFGDELTNLAFQGQLYREAMEASKGEHPSQRDKSEKVQKEVNERMVSPGQQGETDQGADVGETGRLQDETDQAQNRAGQVVQKIPRQNEKSINIQQIHRSIIAGSKRAAPSIQAYGGNFIQDYSDHVKGLYGDNKLAQSYISKAEKLVADLPSAEAVTKPSQAASAKQKPLNEMSRDEFNNALDALVDERLSLVEETGVTHQTRGTLQEAIYAATGAGWSLNDAIEGIKNSIKHGRPDVAEMIVERARRLYEDSNTTPGVDKASPKYDSIKQVLESRKAEAEKQYQQLKRLYELQKGETQPTPTGKPTEVQSQPGETDKKFAERAMYALGAVDLKGIQKVSRGTNSGMSNDGSFWIQLPDNRGVVNVSNVKRIEPDKFQFEAAYARRLTPREQKEGMAAAVYKKGGKWQIDVAEGADVFSVAHDLFGHIYEAEGLISNIDKSALVRALKSKGLENTEENRAQFIENALRDRAMINEYGSFTKKALQRILDIVDSIANIFHRTARGVIRELESGKISGREYSPMQNEGGIVSIETAKTLKGNVTLPNSDIFKNAVENTSGAEITKDGLVVNVVRQQPEEAGGAYSLRKGVFYQPSGSKNKYNYSGKHGYGGEQKFEGITLIKNPIFVKGATGGKAPEVAYDQIKGKGSYQKMRDAVLASLPYYGQRLDFNKIENILEQYGVTDIPSNELYNYMKAAKGNGKAYALQELIVSEAVRNSGYDSVIGYSKRRDGTYFLSEIFDVRELTYPSEYDLEGEISDKFKVERYATKPQSDLDKGVMKSEKTFGKKLIPVESVSEDISTYSDSKLDRMRSAVEKSISESEAIKTVGAAYDGIKRAFYPAGRSEAAQKAAEAIIGQMGKRFRQTAVTREQLNKAVKRNSAATTKFGKIYDLLQTSTGVMADAVFNKMPKQEQYDFIYRIQTGERQPTKQLDEIAGIMSDMFDTLWKEANEVMPESTAYRENYFPGMWEDREGAEKFYANYRSRSLEGSKAHTKAKVFDNIYEGIKAGFVPRGTPVDMFFEELFDTQKYITAHRELQEMEKTGIASLVPAGEKAPSGFALIPEPYGTVTQKDGKKFRYAARDDVAQVFINYLSRSLYDNPYVGNLYKSYMGAANALNQFQLGVGSAFHAGFTGMESVVSQFALGVKALARGDFVEAGKQMLKSPAALYKNPMVGNELLKMFRSNYNGQSVPRIIQWLEMAGARAQYDNRLRTNQTDRMLQDWANGKRFKASLRSPVAIVEQMARPILEWLVPRQKFGIFSEMANEWSNLNPEASFEETRKAMQYIWNRIDSRMGQVVYERMFANNIAKNIVQGLIRAPGWTGGTIVEIGGGVNDFANVFRDIANGKKPVMTDKMAYTISLLTVTALINGVMTALLTGEPPDERDLLAFRTGKFDENGNPERFLLPTYAKDIYAYINKPGRTLLNKTHPLLSLMGDIAENQDYYGVRIADKDDNIAKRTLSRGEYVAKAFVPFWMRGAQKSKERGDSVISMIAPLAGIMPATSEFTKTKAQKLMSEISQEQFSGTSSRESYNRRMLRYRIETKLRNGDPTAIQTANKYISQGRMTQDDLNLAIKNAKIPRIVSSFKRLGIENALKVYAEATVTEKAILKPILVSKKHLIEKLLPDTKKRIEAQYKELVGE